MDFFKDRTYTWWQIGVFKLALLAWGAAIGAYWVDFFALYLVHLVVVALVLSIYIIAVSFRK